MTRSPRFILSLLLVVAAVAMLFAVLRSTEPAAAMAPPGFVDISTAAGIDHVYDGEFEFFVGGGVAAFDCDADGMPELYLAGGTDNAALFRNVSQMEGAVGFRRLSDPTTDLDRVVGAYPTDIDSDGLTDLAVLRNGKNVMLRGLGDCAFERANEMWGIESADAWTTGFSATWETGSTLPTLAFGNYVRLGDDGSREACWDNELFRPDGETYPEPFSLSPGFCSLSVLFSDWARTGQADLRISNDRQYYREGEEQLWNLRPGQDPEPYSRDDGWSELQIFGMGIASHDVTGDGYPEVFLTSMGDNKLQTLTESPSQPIFSDIALDRGVTAHRPFFGDSVKPSTAWHAEFEDLNNDGYIDLFITKGNVDAMVEAAAEDPNNLLIGQPDGSFTESADSSGLLNVARTRGAAVVDLNLDGLLDVVEVNRREPVTVWQNVGTGTIEDAATAGNWLQLHLSQDGPNRDAVGAWIEVRLGERTLTRELTIGGGHAGGQLGWIHFGLGDARSAQVRVLWPDGEEGPWLDVDANTFAIIERNATAAEPWRP